MRTRGLLRSEKGSAWLENGVGDMKRLLVPCYLLLIHSVPHSRICGKLQTVPRPGPLCSCLFCFLHIPVTLGHSVEMFKWAPSWKSELRIVKQGLKEGGYQLKEEDGRCPGQEARGGRAWPEGSGRWVPDHVPLWLQNFFSSPGGTYANSQKPMCGKFIQQVQFAEWAV